MHRVVAVAFLVALVLPAAFAANPPVISSISPQTAIAGTGGFTLTVNGAGFVSGATVRVNGTTRTTTFVSSTQVTAAITSGDVLNAGTLQITATNPGTLASSAVTLTVLPNNPTISSIDPSSLLTGTSNLTITVTGQNFASTAQVRVNTSARTTTFVSDTQLTATLLASDVASPGTLQITVANPNSKTSPAVALTVKNGTATPTITLLSPNSVAAGGAAFTLTVVGTNFVSGSTIKANGVSRATTFVDSTHLTTQITAGDISKAGTISITVLNPDATTSTAATLTITSGLTPQIVSISPSTVTAGAAPFTLTINGNNFASGATVQVGSSSRNATFVSSTVLTVPITTADIVATGQIPITVTTPAPNGGVSNSVPLYVVSSQAPVVTSISPSSVVAGTAGFSLVVNGSGFLLDDVVQVGGSARTTQYISATQLAASIPASDIAAAGILAITVAHKSGGAASSPVNLTVVSASATAITGFNPASATVGAAPFTLAVLGQNFKTDSVVVIDTTPRTTQYVSPTELRVQLSATDLATVRDVPVQIVNADGTTSAAVLFTVTVPQLTITSVNPTSVISGDPGFTLTVSGSGFSASSIININGAPRSTQVNSDGSLSVNVGASEIAAFGTLSVVVTDNGGTSNTFVLQVLRPTITSVNPSSILLGSPDATITVGGTGFSSASKIVFLGSELTTVLNADGTLTAKLTGLDSLPAGQYAVSVRNSAQSTSVPFLITATFPGAPLITAVTPASLQAGSPATTVVVTGTNFVPASVIRVNGSSRTTVYETGTSISATLTAADLAAPGQLRISVLNPDGTVSADAFVTVEGTPASYSPSRRRSAKHP